MVTAYTYFIAEEVEIKKIKGVNSSPQISTIHPLAF
jgi:hypothetical protein